ncbi:MAG: Gfo/Idh/MocA family oxidoreductase [Ignavibacteriales bacterium]|nr:Gfo/Idh/MocA family oxidoreductase [Ignavibacteriales bacterium]
MTPHKIRYGIIGYGLFAERAIAPAIQASANSVLVAVQKRSLEVAREKASALSLRLAFDSVQALATSTEVDAVFIASANCAHHDEVIAVARAGKHILVEKPMAMNTPEAERMVAECERNQVKLMIGQVVRFSPLVNHVRELVKSGALGRIVSARADYSYDARLSRRSWLLDRTVAGGGAVFDVGVHCLDTLRFVLHDEVESVQSMLTPPPTPSATERSAIINLRFSNGTLGSIACSFEGPLRHALLEVVGTEGLAYAYDFTGTDQSTTLHIEKRPGTAAPETESLSIRIPNLYVEEVSAFSRCIIENTTSPIPGIEGIENQKVLDLAMKGGGRISQV